MASSSLFLKPSAVKEIEGIPRKKDRRRIVRRIGALGEEARPRGCEKLGGRDLYRARQGDDRIVYEVDDGQRIVTVVRVAHRRDVYRR